MCKVEEFDIYFEVDICVVVKNFNGFVEGDWMFYMVIKYELIKVGFIKFIKGDMMFMVVNDGLYYGDNVKLEGLGKYKFKLIIFLL